MPGNFFPLLEVDPGPVLDVEHLAALRCSVPQCGDAHALECAHVVLLFAGDLNSDSLPGRAGGSPIVLASELIILT